MKIKDVVEDWGGFEELITDLHQDGEFDVQRDVTLIGVSGASRQIDVLIKHKQGPYEYLTLVECKYWKKKVERANIDILYAGMQDLNAAKGNDALFFPVNPGAEEQSWKRFYEEGLDRFFAGTYAGSYEEELLNEFNTYLPEDPPWEV